MNYLVTFNNTHNAIKAEQNLIAAGIIPKVLPVPTKLGDLCGIAIELPKDQLHVALNIFKTNQVQPAKVFKIILKDDIKDYELYE